MKIGFVYDAVYPWVTGGVQKRVWEIARRLADDHDVHWYGLHYWDGPSIIEREDVTLHGVGEPKDLYVDGRRSITQALYFATRLAGPLLRDECDVIDCQAFPYLSCYTSKLPAMMNGTTYVVTWHEVWAEYWYEYLGWKGLFGRLAELGTVTLPDCHLSVSERTALDLQSLGGRETQSEVLPNGIDIDYIDSISPADQPVDLLFVGRFIEEKNPELLVRAVAELVAAGRDAHCTFVGDGPERDAVEALARELELEKHTTFLEFRDAHEDIIAMMKAADVFVLPSRREGFGITILEALAAGTPVVTLDHPGNAGTELIEDGKTGHTVTADHQAVARVIEDSRTKIHPDDCRAHAAEYDWDAIAERASDVYQSLAE